MLWVTKILRWVSEIGWNMLSSVKKSAEALCFLLRPDPCVRYTLLVISNPFPELLNSYLFGWWSLILLLNTMTPNKTDADEILGSFIIFFASANLTIQSVGWFHMFWPPNIGYRDVGPRPFRSIFPPIPGSKMLRSSRTWLVLAKLITVWLRRFLMCTWRDSAGLVVAGLLKKGTAGFGWFWNVYNNRK